MRSIAAVLTVLLVGKGDGTFNPAMNLMVAGAPSWVSIADLNNDKIPELVVSQENASTVTVLPGMGSLMYATPVVLSVGPGPRGQGIGDFNGDGKPDIAVGNAGASSVSVLINTTM